MRRSWPTGGLSRQKIVFFVFLKPSVHPQEDLHIQFYSISFVHPYKKSDRCQDICDSADYQKHTHVDQTATQSDNYVMRLRL